MRIRKRKDSVLMEKRQQPNVVSLANLLSMSMSTRSCCETELESNSSIRKLMLIRNNSDRRKYEEEEEAQVRNTILVNQKSLLIEEETSSQEAKRSIRKRITRILGDDEEEAEEYLSSATRNQPNECHSTLAHSCSRRRLHRTTKSSITRKSSNKHISTTTRHKQSIGGNVIKSLHLHMLMRNILFLLLLLFSCQAVIRSSANPNSQQPQQQPRSALKFDSESNSYSGLTFTFDPRLDKRVELLHFDHWLSIMQHSSSLLYEALNGRAHLSEVRVLIPYKWRQNETRWPVLHKPGSPIMSNRRLRFADSDVIVGFEDAVHKESPFAVQHDECGKQGLNIQVPISFLEQQTLDSRLKSRLLVREFASYRYGIFKESGFRSDYMYPPFSSLPGVPAPPHVSLLQNKQQAGTNASSSRITYSSPSHLALIGLDLNNSQQQQQQLETTHTLMTGNRSVEAAAFTSATGGSQAQQQYQIRGFDEQWRECEFETTPSSGLPTEKSITCAPYLAKVTGTSSYLDQSQQQQQARSPLSYNLMSADPFRYPDSTSSLSSQRDGSLSEVTGAGQVKPLEWSELVSKDDTFEGGAKWHFCGENFVPPANSPLLSTLSSSQPPDWSAGAGTGTGIHGSSVADSSGRVQTSSRLQQQQQQQQTYPHNQLAFNKQNVMCNERSALDVIRSSDDFRRTPFSPSTFNRLPVPNFKFLQEMPQRVVLCVEFGLHLYRERRLDHGILEAAIGKFLAFDLIADTEFALVLFGLQHSTRGSFQRLHSSIDSRLTLFSPPIDPFDEQVRFYSDQELAQLNIHQQDSSPSASTTTTNNNNNNRLIKATCSFARALSEALALQQQRGFQYDDLGVDLVIITSGLFVEDETKLEELLRQHFKPEQMELNLIIYPSSMLFDTRSKDGYVVLDAQESQVIIRQRIEKLLLIQRLTNAKIHLVKEHLDSQGDVKMSTLVQFYQIFDHISKGHSWDQTNSMALISQQVIDSSSSSSSTIAQAHHHHHHHQQSSGNNNNNNGSGGSDSSALSSSSSSSANANQHRLTFQFELDNSIQNELIVGFFDPKHHNHQVARASGKRFAIKQLQLRSPGGHLFLSDSHPFTTLSGSGNPHLLAPTLPAERSGSLDPVELSAASSSSLLGGGDGSGSALSAASLTSSQLVGDSLTSGEQQQQSSSSSFVDVETNNQYQSQSITAAAVGAGLDISGQQQTHDRLMQVPGTGTGVGTGSAGGAGSSSSSPFESALFPYRTQLNLAGFHLKPGHLAWLNGSNKLAGTWTLSAISEEPITTNAIAMARLNPAGDTVTANCWIQTYYDSSGSSNNDQQQPLKSVKVFVQTRAGVYSSPLTEVSARLEVQDELGNIVQNTNMLDDGLGAPDMTRGDGIHSQYVQRAYRSGYYKVNVELTNSPAADRSSGSRQVNNKQHTGSHSIRSNPVTTTTLTSAATACCGSFFPTSSNGGSVQVDTRHLSRQLYCGTFYVPQEPYNRLAQQRPPRINNLTVINVDQENRRFTLRWFEPAVDINFSRPPGGATAAARLLAVRSTQRQQQQEEEVERRRIVARAAAEQVAPSGGGQLLKASSNHGAGRRSSSSIGKRQHVVATRRAPLLSMMSSGADEQEQQEHEQEQRELDSVFDSIAANQQQQQHQHQRGHHESLKNLQVGAHIRAGAAAIVDKQQQKSSVGAEPAFSNLDDFSSGGYEIKLFSDRDAIKRAFDVGGSQHTASNTLLATGTGNNNKNSLAQQQHQQEVGYKFTDWNVEGAPIPKVSNFGGMKEVTLRMPNSREGIYYLAMKVYNEAGIGGPMSTIVQFWIRSNLSLEEAESIYGPAATTIDAEGNIYDKNGELIQRASANGQLASNSYSSILKQSVLSSGNLESWSVLIFMGILLFLCSLACILLVTCFVTSARNSWAKRAKQQAHQHHHHSKHHHHHHHQDDDHDDDDKKAVASAASAIMGAPHSGSGCSSMLSSACGSSQQSELASSSASDHGSQDVEIAKLALGTGTGDEQNHHHLTYDQLQQQQLNQQHQAQLIQQQQQLMRNQQLTTHHQAQQLANCADYSSTNMNSYSQQQQHLPVPVNDTSGYTHQGQQSYATTGTIYGQQAQFSALDGATAAANQQHPWLQHTIVNGYAYATINNNNNNNSNQYAAYQEATTGGKHHQQMNSGSANQQQQQPLNNGLMSPVQSWPADILLSHYDKVKQARQRNEAPPVMSIETLEQQAPFSELQAGNLPVPGAMVNGGSGQDLAQQQQQTGALESDSCGQQQVSGDQSYLVRKQQRNQLPPYFNQQLQQQLSSVLKSKQARALPAAVAGGSKDTQQQQHNGFSSSFDSNNNNNKSSPALEGVTGDYDDLDLPLPPVPVAQSAAASTQSSSSSSASSSSSQATTHHLATITHTDSMQYSQVAPPAQYYCSPSALMNGINNIIDPTIKSDPSCYSQVTSLQQVISSPSASSNSNTQQQQITSETNYYANQPQWQSNNNNNIQTTNTTYSQVFTDQQQYQQQQQQQNRSNNSELEFVIDKSNLSVSEV